MARLRVAAAALGGALLTAGLLTVAALGGLSGRPDSTGGFAAAQPSSGQPLAFEPNAGRFDSSLDYLVRGRGSTLGIRPTGSVLGVGRSQLTTKLAGASRSAEPTPGSKLRTRVSWYAGADRSKWRTGLPTFAAVTYGGVYPGIDLRYRGENGRIEYDFLLAPHADANRIALDLRGASALRIDRHGDLLARLGRHTVRQLRPVAYQGTERVPVRFVLRGQRLGFRVGEYDSSRPLLIDPVLVYSDFIGGTSTDSASSVAVDRDGNTIVGGSTQSSSIPGTSGAATAAGFILKIAPGGARQWITYLGGYSVNDVATDAAGNVAVVGSTNNTLATKNAAQPTYGGMNVDGFVARLDTNGAPQWVTYLGGNSNDYAASVASDQSGNVYVAGTTNAAGLATGGSYQTSLNQGSISASTDALVVKYNGNGAKLFSTYVGGSSGEDGYGIAINPSCASSCDMFVAGDTTSTDFPAGPAGVQQTMNAGGYDDYVFKLSADGATRKWATYFGDSTTQGGGTDVAWNIAVSPVTGNPSIVGYESISGKSSQAFLHSFRSGDGFYSNPNAVWGGDADEQARDLAFDAVGNIYVTGQTSSASGFDTTGAVQKNFGGGGQDAFAVKFQLGSVIPVWFTYLGGTGSDAGLGIAMGANGGAYVVGSTGSTDFPVIGNTQGADGPTNGFVSLLRVKSPTITASPPDIVRDGNASFAYTDTELNGTFVCRLSPAETTFTACSSIGKQYNGLADGEYTFEVADVDAAGTRGPPVSRKFTVDTKPFASFTIAPNPVLVGRSTTFDGSASIGGVSAITKYEWDLNGDGTFERDSGTTPTTGEAYAQAGTVPVSLRVTTASGATAISTQNLVVSGGPGTTQFGVSINGGDQYTRTPNVTVTAKYPAGVTSLLFSNDGGFDKAQTFPASKTIKWKLDSSGPERLPKIVYVRFLNGPIVSETHIDDIILDETPPTVDQASVAPAAGASSAWTARAASLRSWKLKVKAKDSNSGVSRIQATSNKRKPGKSLKYKRRLTVKSAARPHWVRARDRAGNWSKWKKAR